MNTVYYIHTSAGISGNRMTGGSTTVIFSIIVVQQTRKPVATVSQKRLSHADIVRYNVSPQKKRYL